MPLEAPDEPLPQNHVKSGVCSSFINAFTTLGLTPSAKVPRGGQIYASAPGNHAVAGAAAQNLTGVKTGPEFRPVPPISAGPALRDWTRRIISAPHSAVLHPARSGTADMPVRRSPKHSGAIGQIMALCRAESTRAARSGLTRRSGRSRGRPNRREPPTGRADANAGRARNACVLQLLGESAFLRGRRDIAECDVPNPPLLRGPFPDC